jgi:hypothetical protein
VKVSPTWRSSCTKVVSKAPHLVNADSALRADRAPARFHPEKSAVELLARGLLTSSSSSLLRRGETKQAAAGLRGHS